MSRYSVRGLVLAGGKSKRMGFPKAEIEYHGQPEYLRCCRLLKTVCDEVYLSTSENWAPKQIESDEYRVLPDPKAGSTGPLSGIAAAFTLHAASGWIVLACDLPFFGLRAIEKLYSQRDESKQATCYIGHKGRPEPLCAIYEPSAGNDVVLSFMQERNCAREVLESMEIHTINPDDPNWVRNVNDKEEYEKIIEAAQNEKIEIEIHYVAQLRETVGRAVDRILTQRKSLRKIYTELQQQHGFVLEPQHMRVAVNDRFVDWDCDIKKNDRIMFVPPVAGG